MTVPQLFILSFRFSLNGVMPRSIKMDLVELENKVHMHLRH